MKKINEFYQTALSINRVLRVIQCDNTSQVLSYGQGGVNIVKRGESFLSFSEAGICFYPKGNKKIAFNNMFSLQFFPDRIAFYQKRYENQGSEQWLLDLILDTDHFICAMPHYCGQDNYQLTVSLYTTKIVMYWRIFGPKKNEMVSCIYYVH